jgi:3-oxoacyl-(acyl-carrier-protein) synthase
MPALAESREPAAAGIEVVVTGLGLVLPGCDHRDRFWDQLRDNDSQLRLLPDPAGGGAVAMGWIVDFDAGRYLFDVDERFYSRHSRSVQMYLAALLLSRRDAGLDLSRCDSERVGLFQGTSRDSFAWWQGRAKTEKFTRRDLVAGMPSIGVGLAASILHSQGPSCSFSASCCSGAVAIGHAYREIAAGEVDVAFAGGHDAALCAPLFAMYRHAGLLSESQDPSQAIQPFAGSAGNAFGEGAVVLTLESRRHAEKRGATILATIAGFSYGNAGSHPTHVDRSGDRPARLIRSVLAQGQLSTEEVGAVVAHGNGVPQSDRSELAYMNRVFGERASAVPLVTTKPLWGHTLGASSAVNVAAAVMMVHHGIVSSSGVHAFEGGATPISSGMRLPSPAVVCMSLGIGGNNAAVLVRSNAPPHRRTQP